MDTNPEDDEISLLDLLLVVAENIKLLVIGPVLAGLLALGVGYTLPQKFVSQAILAVPMPVANAANGSNAAANPSFNLAPTPTPAQAAAMMVSPIVLDPIVQSLDLAKGRPLQAVRLELAEQVKAVVGKDTLLRLDVTGPTPLESQAIANAVVDTWLKSTVPGTQDRADLEKRLGHAQTSLVSVTRLVERLTAEGGANPNQPLNRGDAAASLLPASELQGRYQAEILAITRALQGLSRDVVLQPPTLPTQPSAPKKSLIAVLAALATGFALLLFVFVRQAWRNAAQDPEAAQKQARLRAALKL